MSDAGAGAEELRHFADAGDRRWAYTASPGGLGSRGSAWPGARTQVRTG